MESILHLWQVVQRQHLDCRAVKLLARRWPVCLIAVDVARHFTGYAGTLTLSIATIANNGTASLPADATRL
jgi:hypothetical protein